MTFARPVTWFSNAGRTSLTFRSVRTPPKGAFGIIIVLDCSGDIRTSLNENSCILFLCCRLRAGRCLALDHDLVLFSIVCDVFRFDVHLLLQRRHDVREASHLVFQRWKNFTHFSLCQNIANESPAFTLGRNILECFSNDFVFASFHSNLCQFGLKLSLLITKQLKMLDDLFFAWLRAHSVRQSKSDSKMG